MLPHSQKQAVLPPPLELLRNMSAGAVYGLAGKSRVAEGLNNCVSGVVVGAEWRDEQRVLVLKMNSGPNISFIAAGDRLLTECSCRQWSPSFQCSHVVTCWALLKRVVSPQSFASYRFGSTLISDIEVLLGMREKCGPDLLKESSLADSLFDRLERARKIRRAASGVIPEAISTDRRDIRLVLQIEEGGMRGVIVQGNEQLHALIRRVLPADLRTFLSEHYHFRPGRKYFRDFADLKGDYPVVFRQADGKETPLIVKNDEPLRAGIVFSLDNGKVRISKCLDDGSPLSGNAVVAGECLVDPAEKTIHFVNNLDPWKLWDSVCGELVEVCNFRGEPFDRSATTLVTSAVAFNKASMGVSAELVKSCGPRIRFVSNGGVADPTAAPSPSYVLNICDDLDNEFIKLSPAGELAGMSFPLSPNTFRLFSPWLRSGLRQPLRAKKRVTAMIETGFALLETATSTARDTALRRGLGGPGFIRRSIKSDARKIVNTFVRCCETKMQLIFACPDGWRFCIEDRSVQAGLVRILYGMFGIDSFTDGGSPCCMELPRGTLLSRLGELAAALSQAGFSLRLGGESIAPGNWDFAVNADTSGIDWFELRPEIRCNGELLAAEDIRMLLEDGVLRQGNTCYLLGDKERRILEMLVGAGDGKGKRRKKTEIVRIPRLQILDWLELRSHGVTLRLPPEEERLLAGLTRLEKVPELALPAGLRAKLRHYQKEGCDWLAFLHGHRFGACLADDMGLGKTVQTITFLAGLAEGIIPSGEKELVPHLIVVPPSLLFNWESEIARFYPRFRVVTYAGRKRRTDFTGADIVLTSYGILQRDADILARIPFHVAVFDEAQQVKNIHAATTGAARRVNARFKLALTGTPMENHLGEYFSIMDLCVPGLLGSFEEFRRRIEIKGFAGIDTLVRRTRPFILRRTKQMIADELPPRVEADLYLEMNSKQRALYQRTVEEVKGKVSEAFQSRTPGQAKMIALTAILRLRQICLCPSLVDSGTRADSPKLQCLAEQLAELRDEGHSALVFSQFTSYLDIIEEGIKRYELPFVRLDGSTPAAKRKELVNRFQKSNEPLVFLISLKAGGKGLNLTRATYVYHLDPWWNPAVENQASDRAHRIGQTSKVTVTRLLMRHTVEEKMMALKERKLRLYKALLDDASGTGGASLSREDFDFLLAQ